MGKRSKKVTLKKMAKPRLETVFSCPLCSHEKCIECRMNRQSQTGTARCRVCSAGYQTVISYLSDPVDVYAEWVDVVAERASAGASVARTSTTSSYASAGTTPLPRFNVIGSASNSTSASTTSTNDSKLNNTKTTKQGNSVKKPRKEESSDDESSATYTDDSHSAISSIATDSEPENGSREDKAPPVEPDSEDEQFEALIRRATHGSGKGAVAVIESDDDDDCDSDE
jgi:transcription elongation factor Elf1